MQRIRQFLIALLKIVGTTIVVLIALTLAPIFFVLWTIYAWLANHYPNGIMRRRGKELQVATYTYRHSTTSRSLVLCGMVHIAEHDFYNTIRGIIRADPQRKVLYEGVGRLTPEEAERLTPKEREVHEYLQLMLGRAQHIARLLNIAYQTEALPRDPSWINTDVTMYDIVRDLSARDSFTLPQGLRSRMQRPSKSEDAERVSHNLMFANFLPMTGIALLVWRLMPQLKHLRKTILTTRNTVGAEAIVHYGKDADVVATWGAAHLPGMDKILRQNGYRRVRKNWYTFYRVRNYPLVSVSVRKAKEA